MIKAQSRRTLWLLLGIIAGLVLALGHGRVSGLIYAGAQATPGRAADRTPVTIDRAPQRAIKDQYPSFSAVTTSIFSSGSIDRKSTRLNSSHSQISYAV